MKNEKCNAAEIAIPNRAAGEYGPARATMRFPTEPPYEIDFYEDEINFTVEELTGLTRDEAARLYRAKDIAYLQS